MPSVNYNERSWAIDLITDANLWLDRRNIAIKRAGGENTLKSNAGSLFPDVLLFGDLNKGRVLQGWELKMPDTPINDTEFIDNAKKKAKLLSLNSFLLWNVSSAVLYTIEQNDTIKIVKSWNNLSHIKTREEVSQNFSLINDMLIEILNDLNDFISTGTIKTTSVIDVLSSESISSLVQRNVGSYVDALTKAIEEDSDFSNEVTLWWRYAKNDYPEEDNKLVVLARNNLLFLVNKFLFAHILKSYREDASVVDTINHETKIKDALSIFRSISEKCDFWNIFEIQKGEDLLTDNVWEDILSLNDLLKEFSFAKIDKTLLHDLIGSTVYKNKRKFAGQFTTPPELAKLVVKLTIQNKALPSIDPCCGTGTILREIYNSKKEKLGAEQSLATLWGSDKFSLPLQMAMFNLADPEGLGFLTRVFKSDATKLTIGQKIELREPFNGSVVYAELPKFGYIISNLPFVQQEDLEDLNPEVTKINSIISQQLGKDFSLDGRSDLYAYLPFYFWDLLEDNGKISIIVSNSWMGTKWGEIFYEALGYFFDIEGIVTSGNGRWFNNAKVVTNIITLKKKQPSPPRSDYSTIFTVTKSKLADYSNEELEEVSAMISSKSLTDENDISIRSYTHEQLKELRELGLNLNSFFASNEWLLEIGSKLTKVSTLFDIARGERRGWDKLFYPENKNDIEESYLKPVLKTPRSIHNLIAKPDAVAFCCDKSKEELTQMGHIGALNWINKFETQENERGIPLIKSLARAGIHWYTMLPQTMGEMVTSINFGDRLFFARFDEPTFVNQRLVRFTRKTASVDTRLCHALLNSILGMFYIEAMGTGRGEGALDLSKDKIENDLRIINPDLISTENKESILKLFSTLEQREILPLEKELIQEDRIAFDDAVLSSIGFSDHRNEIKEALLSLYRIRTSVNK